MSGWTLAAGTLGLGLVLGFLAQRSRICFVGAIRDWFLAGDRGGLWGVLSFVAAAALTFTVTAAVLDEPRHLSEFPLYRVQLGLTAPPPPPPGESFWMELDL